MLLFETTHVMMFSYIALNYYIGVFAQWVNLIYIFIFIALFTNLNLLFILCVTENIRMINALTGSGCMVVKVYFWHLTDEWQQAACDFDSFIKTTIFLVWVNWIKSVKQVYYCWIQSDRLGRDNDKVHLMQCGHRRCSA